MSDENIYTTDDINPLTIKELLQIKLIEEAEISLIYVIIGYLQEYFGGYPLDDKVVDSFFAKETEKAEILKSLCEKHLKETGRPNDVTLTVQETGHTYLRSSAICNELKQYYTEKMPDFLNHERFYLSKNDDLFKSPRQLSDNQSTLFNFKQYSFLIGAFMKNKIDGENRIIFGNANHKAQMTIDFLCEFKVFDGKVLNITHHFNVPHAISIELETDNLFWKVIADFMQQLKSNL